MSFAALAQARVENAADAEYFPFMDLLMIGMGENYTWQSYETTTEDGYILTMFRITGDAQGRQIEG